MIDPHIVHPKTKHRSSVIWLHGLGADGTDFAPIVPELALEELGAKFIFPNAPVRPITINNGYPMRGWYDILTLDPDNFIHDLEGIRASKKIVEELIAQEIVMGIPPERIIIGGFSQGGAISLFTGLTTNYKLAGILALSTYLPAAEAVMLDKTETSPPVLMIHGTEDMTIRPEFAELSHAMLLSLGCQIEFKLYEMGHSVCAEEITLVSRWIKARLKD